MADEYITMSHTAAEIDSAVTSIVNHVANTTIHVTATDKQNWNAKPNSTDFAAVAFSGSYADLLNTPTIDSALSGTSTNAVQNKVVKAALDLKANTADLAAVALSGAYSDLTGLPDLSKLMTLGLGTAIQKCLDPDDPSATVEKYWLKTLTTAGVYYVSSGLTSGVIGDFPSNWDCASCIVIVANTTGDTGSGKRFHQILMPCANKSGSMIAHIYRRYETSSGYPKDSNNNNAALWIDFAGTVV